MQQILASSMHPSILALARPHPAIRAVDDTEAPILGRRLPRFDRLAHSSEVSAATGPSFLDHLRRLAS